MEKKQKPNLYEIKITTGGTDFGPCIVKAENEKEALLKVLNKKYFTSIYRIDIHQVYELSEVD